MIGDLSIRVHPTASVSEEAVLSPGVQVGAFALIGPRVTIAEGTSIGPHCLIEGPTRIGRYNRFFGHASVGTDPQDLKYRGEESFLTIGDRNLIREFVTIHRGTEGGGGHTTVGSGNLLMTGVHVAHDCRIGDGVILANSATLAGHVTVADFSTVGAFSGVHQFCRVGTHAFIGGYSVITRDALPFIKTVGARGESRIFGINTVGLERKGFSRAQISALKTAYRRLFSRGLKLREAIELIRREGPSSDEVRVLLDFIETSERGFVH